MKKILPGRWPLSISVSLTLASILTVAWLNAPGKKVGVLRKLPEIELAGPTVMLQVQREGGLLLDFRRAGRPVPGAVRVRSQDLKQESAGLLRSRVISLALLGDLPELQETALRLQNSPGVKAIYLIPAWLLTISAAPGVSQITPGELRRRLSAIQVLDVSEPEEFRDAHVPGSHHLSFEKLWAHIDSELPARGKPLAVI